MDQALSAAITCHRNGEIPRAKRLYQAVLNEAPTQPIANHNLALVFVQEGRSQESLFYFKAATASDPTIEQHWRSFFTALIELKQFSDAGALILSMETHAELHNAVLDMRSELTASLSRLEPAEEELEDIILALNNARYEDVKLASSTLLNRYPQSIQLLEFLGASLAELGSLHEALKCFQETVSLNPFHAAGYNNLGSVLKLLDDWPEAMKCFERAISIDPDYFDVLMNAGNLAKDTGLIKDAIAFFEKALRSEPSSAQAQIALGIVSADNGEGERARSLLEAGLKTSSTDPEGLFYLAALYYSANKFAGAQKLLEQALTIEPTNKTARIALERLQFRDRIQSVEFKNLNKITASVHGVFKTNMAPPDGLVPVLRTMQARNFDDRGVRDSRYGAGSCSIDFNLCDSAIAEIRDLTARLREIMENVVGSAVEIHSSFFNIVRAGGGTRPHQHTTRQDAHFGLRDACFTLVYYVDVGDQDCDEPGTLKLLEPSYDILPSNGDVIITEGSRQHYACYGGKTDRVMVGMNFYATGAPPRHYPMI